jgi:hypothetical protein
MSRTCTGPRCPSCYKVRKGKAGSHRTWTCADDTCYTRWLDGLRPVVYGSCCSGSCSRTIDPACRRRDRCNRPWAMARIGKSCNRHLETLPRSCSQIDSRHWERPGLYQESDKTWIARRDERCQHFCTCYRCLSIQSSLPVLTCRPLSVPSVVSRVPLPPVVPGIFPYSPRTREVDSVVLGRRRTRVIV